MIYWNFLKIYQIKSWRVKLSSIHWSLLSWFFQAGSYKFKSISETVLFYNIKYLFISFNLLVWYRAYYFDDIFFWNQYMIFSMDDLYAVKINSNNDSIFFAFIKYRMLSIWWKYNYQTIARKNIMIWFFQFQNPWFITILITYW